MRHPFAGYFLAGKRVCHITHIENRIKTHQEYAFYLQNSKKRRTFAPAFKRHRVMAN